MRAVGVRILGDLATESNPRQSERESPTWADLGSRRLLDEVRMRLLALTQTDSTHEPDAESLRRGVHQLETIVARLQWLADMKDEHQPSPAEPIPGGRQRHAAARAAASAPTPPSRVPTGADPQPT
jgi:hypothetical protein